MHIATANFQGNPNIGLFCFATDKYCLIPMSLPKKDRHEFEQALKVPLYEMKAVGTDLLGVFFAGNSDVLLVPEVMLKNELKELERLGINYAVVPSDLTALGNNILLSEHGCIVNPEYEDKAIKFLEKTLKVSVKKGKISEFDIVGSLAVGTKKGLLVSADILDFESKFLHSNLKLKVTKGTMNFGSPYVKSAVVANSHGFIAGDASGGPEIQNADEALGFMDNE